MKQIETCRDCGQEYDDLEPHTCPEAAPTPVVRCAACGAYVAPITPDAELCGPCDELQDGDGNAARFQPEPF